MDLEATINILEAQVESSFVHIEYAGVFVWENKEKDVSVTQITFMAAIVECCRLGILCPRTSL